MNIVLSSVLLLALVASSTPSMDGESCYSYGGGSVYPSHHYARGDHDLHSTKAVSKSRLNGIKLGVN